jgi:hypothetical protein
MKKTGLFAILLAFLALVILPQNPVDLIKESPGIAFFEVPSSFHESQSFHTEFPPNSGQEHKYRIRHEKFPITKSHQREMRFKFLKQPPGSFA